MCVCFKALLSPCHLKAQEALGTQRWEELGGIFFHFSTLPSLVFSFSRLGSRKRDEEMRGTSFQRGAEVMRGLHQS